MAARTNMNAHFTRILLGALKGLPLQVLPGALIGALLSPETYYRRVVGPPVQR